MEDQCRMQITGLGWVEVFYPAGTNPVLSLNSDMQGRVMKVIFGDGKE
jgi:hypothetical protein